VQKSAPDGTTDRTMTPSLSILADPPPPPTAIGLIAGGGRLPILVAEGLREAGHPVHGLGLLGQYEPELPALCESFRDVGLLRVGSWGRILSRMDIHHAVMVGRVDKAKLMHDPLRLVRNTPDLRTVVAWFRHLRHDRRSSAVLAAIAEELERRGVSLLDSTSPIPDHLATAGVMTRTHPNHLQRSDIEFVWPLLAELLRLDIGQSLAVRERDVIAVEAVEGTDRMIERVSPLCRAKGWTLCKGARAGHDRRSDVPTVGIQTVENLAKHGAGCLAVAAGDVIMIDRDQMLARADELGIAVVGVPHAQPGARRDERESGIHVIPSGSLAGARN
jgi:DUF1009 family protein